MCIVHIQPGAVHVHQRRRSIPTRSRENLTELGADPRDCSAVFQGLLREVRTQCRRSALLLPLGAARHCGCGAQRRGLRGFRDGLICPPPPRCLSVQLPHFTCKKPKLLQLSQPRVLGTAHLGLGWVDTHCPAARPRYVTRAIVLRVTSQAFGHELVVTSRCVSCL